MHFDEGSECTEAIYILLAINTPKSTKSENYMFLKERSTKSIPLSSIRLEWLSYLKRLYLECFRFSTEKTHILPSIDTGHGLTDYELLRLKTQCFDMLAKHASEFLFSNVRQIIFNKKIYSVPNQEGITIKMKVNNNSFMIIIINISFEQILKRSLISVLLTKYVTKIN